VNGGCKRVVDSQNSFQTELSTESSAKRQTKTSLPVLRKGRKSNLTQDSDSGRSITSGNVSSNASQSSLDSHGLNLVNIFHHGVAHNPQVDTSDSENENFQNVELAQENVIGTPSQLSDFGDVFDGAEPQVDDIHNDISLIPIDQIPLNRLGELLTLKQSVSFIPNNLIKRIRKVWIRYMQRIKDRGDSIDWRRYFLLPSILFESQPTSTRELKIFISSKLKLLEKDDWSKFTLSNLEKRMPPKSGNSDLVERVMKYIKGGEIRKATQVLMRSDAPLTENVFEKLQGKHPNPNQHVVSPPDWERVTGFIHFYYLLL
jgi:hypothetical protein